jgi:hypothetical protein
MKFTQEESERMFRLLVVACAEPPVHDRLDDALSYQAPDWRTPARSLLNQIALRGASEGLK